jgi:hypothetical protein
LNIKPAAEAFLLKLKFGNLQKQKFYSYLLLTLIIIFGLLRITSTYRVFWQTWDEPAHIAAGIEWLDKGQYTYEHLHAPLARVMSALGPYLDGVRSIGEKDIFEEGNALLHSKDTYERTLTLARLGILPFFVLATLVVWMWAKFQYGVWVALLSVILFTTLPPILAHSGLATTDMALAATFGAALFAFCLWLEKPTLRHSHLLGITVGLACLSRLTALPFLIVSGSLTASLYIFKKKLGSKNQVGKQISVFKQWIASSGIALLICFVLIWAGYRFSFAPLTSARDIIRPQALAQFIVKRFGNEGSLHDIAYFIAERVPLPAPEFFSGIISSDIRNSEGHTAYFMGEVKKTGWWYFFLVVLFVKTPLAFLVLAALGFIMILKRAVIQRQEIQLLVPAVAALAVLAVSMSSTINIGVRLVLWIYPLLAIIAGYGAYSLWHFRRSQIIGSLLVIGLLVWQITSSFATHPDYIAYFNELAGKHPEEIVTDSDLDWGQDLKRLATTLKQRGIKEFSFSYNGSANLDQFNLPPRRELSPYRKTTGWIAVSLMKLQQGTNSPSFAWLKEYQPVEKVGKSIWLYYIPIAQPSI